MMRQYLEIKARHPDSILFFRMGDFYEMFLDDALLASKILDITLTSRNKGGADEIPFCGVPYHSVQPYIARLIEAGHRVAICEQVEDPKQAKGIVKREVVQVVTPALVTESESLTPGENSYLLALCPLGQQWGAAWLDLSTGEFKASELEMSAALQRLSPPLPPGNCCCRIPCAGNRRRNWPWSLATAPAQLLLTGYWTVIMPLDCSATASRSLRPMLWGLKAKALRCRLAEQYCTTLRKIATQPSPICGT